MIALKLSCTTDGRQIEKIIQKKNDNALLFMPERDCGWRLRGLTIYVR